MTAVRRRWLDDDGREFDGTGRDAALLVEAITRYEALAPDPTLGPDEAAPVLMPPVTGRPPGSPVRRWRRPLAVFLTVLVTVGVVVAGVVLAGPTAGGSGAVVRAVSSTSGGSVPDRRAVQETAASVLTALAASMQPASWDGGSGRYEFSRQRQWAQDMTGNLPGGTSAVTVEFTQVWLRAADRSGRLVRTRPADPGAPADVTEFAAGGFCGLAGAAVLPTERAGLVALLDRQQPPQVGPAARVRAVADLYTWHVVPLATRRAVLALLAEVDRLTYRGVQADAAGREGVAVSIDHDGARDLLLFSATTGALLAHQWITLVAPRGLRIPEVVDHRLYLEYGYLDQPPADAAGSVTSRQPGRC